jgi:hypothetical protein
MLDGCFNWLYSPRQDAISETETEEREMEGEVDECEVQLEKGKYGKHATLKENLGGEKNSSVVHIGRAHRLLPPGILCFCTGMGRALIRRIPLNICKHESG